jgi:hypothetical protein
LSHMPAIFYNDACKYATILHLITRAPLCSALRDE